MVPLKGNMRENPDVCGDVLMHVNPSSRSSSSINSHHNHNHKHNASSLGNMLRIGSLNNCRGAANTCSGVPRFCVLNKLTN